MTIENVLTQFGVRSLPLAMPIVFALDLGHVQQNFVGPRQSIKTLQFPATRALLATNTDLLLQLGDALLTKDDIAINILATDRLINDLVADHALSRVR